MSVKIWGSVSQAFTEPQNVPRRYDSGSGAYVDTTGKAYSEADAAWTERWSKNKRLYLYNEGDECTDVTGGWVGYAAKSSSWSGGTPTVPSITRGAFSMTVNPSKSNTIGQIKTSNPIDVTGYSKLCIEYSGSTGSYSSVYFFLNKSNISDVDSSKGSAIFLLEKNDSVENGISEMNISDIGSSEYIYINFTCGTSANLELYKVWLE